MAEVILENVTKVYPGDIVAVRGVNLQIRDTELLVLVGPSGCGKSTTLRMIAGLEEATEGTIRIGEKVVNDVPPRDRDIAMVFQNYALYPHMTVYKNMAFGLKLRGYPKAEIKQRVSEAAAILGIEELLDRKPKALSGGQRQRVAVGRAIVRKPKAFLLDEPLSNLDAKLRLEMRAELNKLHQRLETTMIYVTHDQVEAMTLGDRIVVMNEGRVQQIAEPLELYNRPVNRFVAGFVGTPPMNFMDGRLTGDDGALWFESGTVKLKLRDWMKPQLRDRNSRNVSLGIRPEDLNELGGSAESRNGATLSVTINVVEPLGDEMIVYFSTGQQDLIGKVASRHGLKVNDKLDIALNMDNVHLFDADTGENVSLDGRPEAR